MNSQLTFNQKIPHKPIRGERMNRYVPNFNLNTQPHWKSYVPLDFQSNNIPTSINQQHSNPKNSRQSVQYSRTRRREDIAPGKQIDYRSQREESVRRQEISKRVRQLQQKVLPMIERDQKNDDVRDIAWQSRIEGKLVHLQGAMDGFRKQIQIQMEKRLLELENMWEEKFTQFVMMREGQI